MEWLFVVLGILLFLLIIVVLNIKIVPQSKAYVIERLGTDRKSTRLNSSHDRQSRMPSSA